MNLENKSAIVTGGTAGIGRAIALKYAQSGANVAIFGTNEERGQKVLEELKEHSKGKVLFLKVDVSNTQEVLESVNKVIEEFGQIDVLVNNAGITKDNLMLKMTEDDWDRVIDVNLKSAFNTAKAVLKPMMKARSGSIINVSSVVGLTGNAGQVNYAASKSGIHGLTKSLAKELAARNVRVNCIAPGFIETKMTDVLSETIKGEILKGIPMRRMGDPNEIAEVALFLASKQSSYVTGQILAVDGGMTM